MKNSFKLILLMLALILALSLFASCAPEVPDEGTEAPTSADGITTDAPETEAPETEAPETAAPTQKPTEKPEPDGSVDTSDGFGVVWFVVLTVSLLGAAALTAKRKNLF